MRIFPRCKGLMLLQTYTTLTGDALVDQLPTFLNIGVDVTEDPAFSMFNLSLKEEWTSNGKFCLKMRRQESIVETSHDFNETHEALNRLHEKKSREMSNHLSFLLKNFFLSKDRFSRRG